MTNEKKNEFEIVEINETTLQSKIYAVRGQKVGIKQYNLFARNE